MVIGPHEWIDFWLRKWEGFYGVESGPKRLGCYKRNLIFANTVSCFFSMYILSFCFSVMLGLPRCPHERQIQGLSGLVRDLNREPDKPLSSKSHMVSDVS